MSESTTRAAINIVSVNNESEYRVGIDYNENADDNEILYTLDVNGNVRFNGPARLKKQIIIEDSEAEGIEIETPPTADTVIVDLNNEEKRLVFKQYSADNSNPEIFRLPVINSQAESSASYDILTTKNLIGIEQGGTGASTTEGARTALGITSDYLGTILSAGITNIGNIIGKDDAVLEFPIIEGTSATFNIINTWYGNGINFYEGAESNTNPKLLGSLRGYYSTDSSGSITQNFRFEQPYFSPSGEAYSVKEVFRFPNASYVTEAPATIAYYRILTSKDAVTITQGGTGATTATEAMANLGITLSNLGGKPLQTSVTFNTVTTNATATSFISTITQNSNGVINATLQSLPYASANAPGIVSTDAQVFSGVKTFNNSVTFNDSITVSSSMTVNSLITGKSNLDLYGNLRLKESVDSTTAALFLIYNKDTASTDHTLAALQYSYNSNNERTNYYENYSFPTPDVGLNANKSYSILTTKQFNYRAISRNITLETNDLCDSVSNLRYYTTGNIGMLYTAGGYLTLSSSVNSSQWYEIASISSEYAPLTTVRGRCQLTTASPSYSLIEIQSTGTIRVYIPAPYSVSSAVGMYFNLTFPVRVYQ